MARAARALGLDVTSARRPSVVVVGLHPRVAEECDRFYSSGYRFTFLRPDRFNAAADLPASTDAVLLCRKTLSAELVQALRRYNMPG